MVEEDLYEGTAKSMEGVLSNECYAQAKDEGCCVEVVWQDGDSSSAKSVALHHPNGKVYKCGGHVGRAHTNCLKEAAKKKEFSVGTKNKYKDAFTQVSTAKGTRLAVDASQIHSSRVQESTISAACNNAKIQMNMPQD